MSNLWGGRFAGTTDETVKRFNDSFRFDWRLWREDIEGSIAYAGALGEAGILSPNETKAICSGLQAICQEIQDSIGAQNSAGSSLGAGPKELTSVEAEDIHSYVEGRLRENIGPLAGKLHTGRSRNDQVATDTRLYVRRQIQAVLGAICVFQGTLTALAERELETVLPGLTHMQHAQPVLLAHHLLAYFWMLQRDRERFQDLLKRVNVLPLGSGALAGTTAPIDRHRLAQNLGFDRVSENSMDAVSDRDYIVEFLSASSLLLVHLSRLAEEVILWNTPEFGFIDLTDEVTTGSSMMPQKKNPDVAELARAKPGRVAGNLMALFTVLKGLPLAYNKDLQEDKEGLFDTAETLEILLPAFNRMMETARFNRERMANAVKGDFSTATDLADVLVQSGMPFREAHEIVGQIVGHCLAQGAALEDLTPEELARFAPALAGASTGWEAVLACLGARNVPGGTGPDSVRFQLDQAKNLLH